MNVTDLLTVPAVATMFGLPYSYIERLARRGEIEFQRIAYQRVIRREDLDKVKAACVARGYLKPDEVAK